jgi:ribonuclease J
MKTKQNETTRVVRQKNERIDQALRRHRTAKSRAPAATAGRVRITPLGGQHGIGAMNLIVLEYGNDALVLDCGFDLGVDLPGINYAIPVTDYLQTIRHKIRGYVISHGHLDHIGSLVHIVPQFPAPIFGSQFTIGMVRAQFEKAIEMGLDFAPDYRVMDMDAHQQVKLGELAVELIRVTHAIPESSAIVVDTPAGRVINTGDFRLDPEPLDKMPTDIERLKQLGQEGVLLLMSESTNTTRLGRTPTEHTLQDSFYELVAQAKGRVFVAVFSTNMNRVQMIVNAAAEHGRKVALEGRSMMAAAELAVRLGNLKIPKGVLVPIREAADIKDDKIVVICTGGQGEPGAAMSRMSAGEHRYVNLKADDSVVISSTPIPGNEQSYQRVGDDLAGLGVKQFRHATHELDGSGPLHVSGHASRDEYAEMIRMTRPKYFMPIYGGPLSRQYHKQLALKEGIAEKDIIMAGNGMAIELSATFPPKIVGRVTSGALLVDQTGSVVPEIVTKDRLLLKDDGFVIIAVTSDQKSGRLLTSPDILTRGCIAVRDSHEIVDNLRLEVRKMASAKITSRTGADLFKSRLKDMASEYIYRHTGCTPIVIPVVNLVGSRGTNRIPRPVADVC